MTEKEFISKGRELCFILRHSTELIDKHGWANVNMVLNKLNIRYDILFLIVKNNNKQRFEFGENGKTIRARQGHSVDVDVEMDIEKPDIELYHGTSSFYIDSILKNGIEHRNRQHVHLTSFKDTALKSGKRHGGDAKVVVIDQETMNMDGIVFYHSRNDVWLTEYVDPKYIKFII